MLLPLVLLQRGGRLEAYRPSKLRPVRRREAAEEHVCGAYSEAQGRHLSARSFERRGESSRLIINSRLMDRLPGFVCVCFCRSPGVPSHGTSYMGSDGR